MTSREKEVLRMGWSVFTAASCMQKSHHQVVNLYEGCSQSSGGVEEVEMSL